jgi:predicted nucleotidyltransferase
MFKHHQDTINNVIKKMKENDNVLALIIAGSIAHGFAAEDSDVDIMIVVSDEEYAERHKNGQLLYWENESSTYEGGYVDGKYVCVDYIKSIAKDGYEAAKFAFNGVHIAFSKIPELEELIKEAAQYPMRYKENRIKWFYSKFHEWYWYYNDGVKKNNSYMISYTLSNMILFGGRAVLAYNELLFPYHKWFLKVLEGAKEKPEDIINIINTALDTKSPDDVKKFADAIINFTDWGIETNQWAKCLMADLDLGSVD